MVGTRSGKMLSGKYEIRLEGDFEKNYRRLDSNMTRRINEAIETISKHPYAGDKLKEKRFKGLYKYRVGSYRIIYDIDPQNRVCYLQNVWVRGKAYK